MSTESVVARSARWRSASWPRWAPLALIALVALLVRLLLVLEPRVVWGDEPFYLWLGRNWITGQGFQFVGHPDVHHGPLFPMLAGLVYQFTHNLELASDILFVVLGGLLVLPVYGLGAEVYDRRVGLAAAALAAVWPGLSVAVLNWGSLTEPPYVLFVTTGLYLGAVALRGRWDCFRRPVAPTGPGARWWVHVLAGLSIGLAYLTRPEAVIYIAIIGLAILVINLIQGRGRSLTLWRDLALLALGFGACFVPYAIYVHAQTGAWMVSEKVGVAYLTGIGLAHGDTGAFDRSTWGLDSTGLETFFFSSESYTISMLQLVLGDLGLFVRIIYLNVMRFARVLIDWSLLPVVTLPLLILGLFDRGWSRERTLKELYLLLSWVPVLSFILFFIQARYLVAAMPVVILWVARGALKLGDWLVGTASELRTPPQVAGVERPLRLVGRRSRLAFEWLPVALTALLLLGAQERVRQDVTGVGSVSPAHRAVGEMLAQRTPADAVIMCRYPAIAFHADRVWTPTPNASWEQVLNYARHKGATYFVIDQRELRYRPQFQPLVSGADVPPQLELLFEARVQEGLDDGERLVVYHLVDR